MNEEYILIDKNEYDKLIKLKNKYSKDIHKKDDIKNIKIIQTNKTTIDITEQDLEDIKAIAIEELKNDIKQQIKDDLLESDEDYLYSDGSDYEA